MLFVSAEIASEAVHKIESIQLLGRPTYMSADFYFTTDSSSFFFLLFCPLISELAEQNSTKIGNMLKSKCNLKTHVQNLGFPLPLQIGGPKTTFLDDFAT